MNVTKFLLCATGAFVAIEVLSSVVLPCVSSIAWAYKNRCRHTSGQDEHPWAVRTKATPHPPRYDVAIVMALDEYISPEMRKATIENKRRYAEFWHYALIAPSAAEINSMANGYPVAWTKLSVVQDALRRHEYAFVIDGDAIIMRHDVDIGLAIDDLERKNKSLLISQDMNNLNSGIFLVKRSVWASQFLSEAFKAQKMLAHGRPVLGVRTLPLRYENRAFFYLSGMYPTCLGVRRTDTILAPTHKNHTYFKGGILVVDRCLINQRPREGNFGHDTSSAAFIYHTPGHSMTEKAAMLWKLLGVAGTVPAA